LEQWAAMAATSRTGHLLIYEKGEMSKIDKSEKWIEESVKVFEGNFTCPNDKLKLVDVVLGLYAYSILCGGNTTSSARRQTISSRRQTISRHGTFKGSFKSTFKGSFKGTFKASFKGTFKGGNTDGICSSVENGATMEAGGATLNAMINRNRASIFPPEHFSDTVEFLEAELDSLVQDKDSSIMTQTEYDALILARSKLSSIHGDELSTKAQNRLQRYLSRVSDTAV